MSQVFAYMAVQTSMTNVYHFLKLVTVISVMWLASSSAAYETLNSTEFLLITISINCDGLWHQDRPELGLCCLDPVSREREPRLTPTPCLFPVQSNSHLWSCRNSSWLPAVHVVVDLLLFTGWTQTLKIKSHPLPSLSLFHKNVFHIDFSLTSLTPDGSNLFYILQPGVKTIVL